MAVAFDAKSSLADATGNTLTVAHTCSGSDRVLIVFTQRGGGNTCNGVTYNGVAMTLVGTINTSSGFRQIKVWKLIGPDSGTNNIVATYNTSGNNMGLTALSFTGGNEVNGFNSTDG